MSLKPLWQDDFAPRSPLSVRPPADVGRDGQLLELRDELARRLRAYPGMVERGTMKPADAERFVANWRSIVADYERDAAADHARDVADDDVSWDAKVRELRRELALRRQFYPRRIASVTNPLSQADAVKRSERLDAVYHRYWAQLWRFTPLGHDWRDDAALALWIAEAHLRREGPAWDAACRHDDLAATPEAGDTERSAEAKRQAARWHRIRDTAVLAAGAPGTATWPAPEVLHALHAAALDAVFAIADAHGHADPHANQLAMLARWLERRALDRHQPRAGFDRGREGLAA